MYKKEAIISDIGHSFEEINGKVIFITTKGDCVVKNLETKEILLTISGGFSKLGKYSDNEFFLGYDFKTKVINLETFEAIDLPFMIKVLDEVRFIYSKIEEGYRFLGSNLRDGSNCWQISIKSGKFLKLYGDKFVNSKFLRDTIITCYNSKNGHVNWTNDITHLGEWIDYAGREQSLEVRDIIGVWNEVLWLNLNNGSFLLMDVNTGIFQKHLRFEDTGFKGNLFQAFIDKDNEIIYGLFLDQLSIFDMKSCTTEVIDLSEEFKNEKIESRKDVIKIGDHLVFADDYNNKIASLNLSNKKLDWVYNFVHLDENSQERPRGPRKLEFMADKLFVLDNKNTLHIFERESQSS